MTRRVVFAPEALADLDDIFSWVADATDVAVAQSYVDRIREYCQGFAVFPKRGTLRSDLRPGLRTIGYRRRLTIAFVVDGDEVVMVRFAHRGRDIAALFTSEDS
ncbi:MAG: type II toxin-antitoxin system RelE/ParE family toxin [Alphaproteobacteria bacterium]|nr:type II toxin-antitoxin system RelE/ParE family toxin [Alphaproteobacteria bacterium]MCW5743497.1 type II toxin-antitoxin system RelE/ParE family toxin [Alphaproteobacteria bacterium]